MGKIYILQFLIYQSFQTFDYTIEYRRRKKTPKCLLTHWIAKSLLLTLLFQQKTKLAPILFAETVVQKLRNTTFYVQQSRSLMWFCKNWSFLSTIPIFSTLTHQAIWAEQLKSESTIQKLQHIELNYIPIRVPFLATISNGHIKKIQKSNI